jgi:2'-5' RNA ligase
MAHAVKDMLEPIIKKTSTFELETVGLGAFPDPARPRTIWAGIDQGADTVSELHAAIYNRLIKAGFNLDDRPFVAHITLGRVKGGPPQVLGECLGEDASNNFGITTVRHFYCYESELKRTGAEYSALWVLPFRKGGRQPAPTSQPAPPESKKNKNNNGESVT